MLWWDRRGDGRERSARVPCCGIDTHIADVLTVLDGRRAVAVVGHSFGGVIADGVVARSPESVRAVAAYESCVAWAPGWDDRVMLGVLASVDPEAAALRLMFGGRHDEMSGAERERRRALGRGGLRRRGAVGSRGSTVRARSRTVSRRLRRERRSRDARSDRVSRTPVGLGRVRHGTRCRSTTPTAPTPEGFAMLVRRAIELSRA